MPSFRSLLQTWCLTGIIVCAANADTNSSTIVVNGELTRSDHETYREVQFEVPEGVKRITVNVEYSRENRTVVDLGLFDPERFRGWSGGNKSSFTLSESDATPSYLPGPLIPGTWTLILGVPNIREGSVSEYRAEIVLESGAQAGTRPFSDTASDHRAGWYRGELHAHSGHSDGSCLSQSGASVPCPVYRSVEAAAALGLDFLAMTEHNAISHHQSLRELQLAFDQMVLIAGREITTFYGHANIFGTTEFVDFRATQHQIDPVLKSVAESGGLVSINHPGLPSGELCMGCGWVADTDYSLVNAIEIINGSVIDSSNGEIYGPLSGIPFWENLLNQGHRITGIAGSDNHNADLEKAGGRRSALGQITTVIHANSLSQAELMNAIKLGRVFIDLEASRDRVLDIHASSAGQTVSMGEVLHTAQDDNIEIVVHIENTADAQVILYRNGVALDDPIDYTRTDGRVTARSRFTSEGRREWIRAEVIDSSKKVLMLSNPVYINFTE